MKRLALYAVFTLFVVAVMGPVSLVLADPPNEAAHSAEAKPGGAKKKQADKKQAAAKRKAAAKENREKRAKKESKQESKAKAKSADETQEEPKQEAESKEEGKQDADKEDEKQDEEQRKTCTVQEKLLKIEVEVSGDLVAEKMTEVKLDAESWTKFKIEEVAAHGARVRAGETLIRFDPEDLNEAIANLEIDQRISQIALIKTEQELPRLEEALKRQLTSAQREWDHSQEDYSRYTDEERDLVVKQYAMRLKQSKFQLDYAKDELEQLEKMYEADDLTEETEEMILRRQRTQYEFTKFSYEIAKYNNALSMETYLPRQDERLKESQRLVELALERAKTSSELDLTRARYELEKAQIARRKALEKHSEMIADKQLMTIKSPAAGVVYYGRCVNGKWSEIASMRGKLLPEKSVSKDTVMMTIVDPTKMVVQGTVAEKDLPSVQQGQPAKLALTAEGAEPIDAVVAEVDAVPMDAGKFGVKITITGDTPKWLAPGMTGKAKVLTYQKKNALLVPKEAVHTDEETGKRYVWEVESDDDEVEIEKEWVKVGKTKDKEIEILRGVEAGDVLSLESDEEATEEDDDEEEDDDD